jgi:hypothetical protein
MGRTVRQDWELSLCLHIGRASRAMSQPLVGGGFQAGWLLSLVHFVSLREGRLLEETELWVTGEEARPWRITMGRTLSKDRKHPPFPVDIGDAILPRIHPSPGCGGVRVQAG